MKRKNLLRVLEAILFCMVLLICIQAVSVLLERKQSRQRFADFFEKAPQHDLLFVGDSHMVNAVFPMELWEKYGITSYNIASYGNTLPVSYWTLVNALDYASPKVVVVGIKDVDRNIKLTGSSSDVHTAFDCYPLSINKIRAIEDLMDDPVAMDDVGNHYAEMKWEYYFTLGKYHSRWSELNTSDFRITPNCQKGSDMAIGVAIPNEYDLIDPDRAADEYGWGYEYLRRIIEECRNRGIEVLLTSLPYPSDMDDQMAANTVGGIAEEYGVNYIDFVSLDQVVDYGTDCLDPASHLNASGAQKVTDYLGRYLVDHYAVEDRRNDQQYADWNEDYDVYRAYKSAQIAGQGTLENLLMLLHDESYSACIAIRPQANLYWNDQQLTLLHNIARERIFEEDAFAKWSNSLFPLEGLEEALWLDEAYFLMIDRENGTFEEFAGNEQQVQLNTSFGLVTYDAAAQSKMQLSRDGAQIAAFGPWEEGKEIQILVVDKYTGLPVTCVQM